MEEKNKILFFSPRLSNFHQPWTKILQIMRSENKGKWSFSSRKYTILKNKLKKRRKEKGQRKKRRETEKRKRRKDRGKKEAKKRGGIE